MQKPKTVDEYIALAPPELKERLVTIRTIITSIAPKAEEKLSYGMPYYGYQGRLAYFAYAKEHIGLYLTPPIMEMFAKELKDYSTATATIRFPNNKPLPVTLIKKLIKARRELNEKLMKKRNVA